MDTLGLIILLGFTLGILFSIVTMWLAVKLITGDEGRTPDFKEGNELCQ